MRARGLVHRRGSASCSRNLRGSEALQRARGSTPRGLTMATAGLSSESCPNKGTATSRTSSESSCSVCPTARSRNGSASNETKRQSNAARGEESRTGAAQKRVEPLNLRLGGSAREARAREARRLSHQE